MKEIDTGVFTVENNNNIYIIGDIHGDYQCLVHCLVDLCKTCDVTKIYDDKEFNTENREKLEWKKNNTSVVVFCGDLIDRKRFKDHVLDDECSDIFILINLLRLKKDAISNGGNIIIISGNHEIMNINSPDDDNLYISPANKVTNNQYFKDSKFIEEYISNSYAWIKINDILIAHGGLCSEYLRFLNNTIDSEKIISYVNDQYRDFFINLNKYKQGKEEIKKKYELASNLFINYSLEHKKHNVFWCREWGYGEVNCDNFTNILKQVNCQKMIISHCPQFLSPNVPKMINFECKNGNNNYLLARIDLGMSRSFDYNNNDDQFFYYLSNNYNRKMAVLKLLNFNGEIYFNETGIITSKLSCIQYLLLKYGMTKKNWSKNKINSNWIGFNFIDDLLNKIKNNKDNDICKNIPNDTSVLLCLLYPIYMKGIILDSINQFNVHMVKLKKKLTNNETKK
jgi:hypothetical protein